MAGISRLGLVPWPLQNPAFPNRCSHNSKASAFKNAALMNNTQLCHHLGKFGDNNLWALCHHLPALAWIIPNKIILILARKLKWEIRHCLRHNTWRHHKISCFSNMAQVLQAINQICFLRKCNNTNLLWDLLPIVLVILLLMQPQEGLKLYGIFKI